MSFEQIRKRDRYYDNINEDYPALQNHCQTSGMPTAEINNSMNEAAISCKGCGQYINDKSYLEMAGDPWHVTCLSCNTCGVSLQHEQSCYSKEGLILCKNDYFSRYSRACAGCGCLLSPQDYVLKARNFVYHLPCFTCITCRRQMNSGERFSVDEETGRLHCCYCWKHYDDLKSNQNGMDFHSNYYNPTDNPFSTSISEQNVSYAGDLHGVGGGQSGGGGAKLKRVRTSFKHNQLRAMKSYFNLNHNPDAKDLKQLAQETGLTKRVLQVWFQNARAKYRRSHTHKHSTDKELGKKVKGEENPTDKNSESVSPSIFDGSGDKEALEQQCSRSIADSNPSDDIYSPNETYSLSPTSTAAFSPSENKQPDFFQPSSIATTSNQSPSNSIVNFSNLSDTVYAESMLTAEPIRGSRYTKPSQMSTGIGEANSWQSPSDYTLFSLDGGQKLAHGIPSCY